MHPYHTGDNFTVGDVDEKKDITNYQNCYSCKDLLELHQNYNYTEELLLPDIFKLDKLEESNLKVDINNCYPEKPHESCSLKRPFNDDETPSINIKRIGINLIIDNNEEEGTSYSTFNERMTIIKNIEQSAQSPEVHMCTNLTTKTKGLDSYRAPTSIDVKNIHIKHELPCYAVKKELKLKSYRRNYLSRSEFTTTIYKDAIKSIVVDADNLFNKAVLEKIRTNYLKNKIKYLVKSKLSIDLSRTYSNVRKYILKKLYPFLDDIILTLDVPITPGMSVSELRHNCLSNKIFFEKLSKNCRKIAEDVRMSTYDSLSHVFQYSISFYSNDSTNSTCEKINFSPLKKKFLPELKILVMNTIFNLPDSIVSEIKKFDRNNILNSFFLKMHGILISKSLIRNLELLFNSNKNKFINGGSDDDLDLFNDLLKKIGELVKTSYIFDEVVFFPDKPTLEKLSKYLLSDIYGVSSRFHNKLSLFNEKADERQVSNDNNYNKSSETNIYVKEKYQLSELSNIKKSDPVTSNIADKEIEISDKYKHSKIVEKSPIKNSSQLEGGVISRRFNLSAYHKINLFSTKNTVSIYEKVIEVICIDDEETFKNSVLKELNGDIIGKGFIKSSIDVSLAHSNIRKYVLNKVSPYINDIITTTDILITPDMSIHDMKLKCISNNFFFERLREICEKLVRDAHLIPETTFSNIIPTHINFGSSGRISIRRKKNKFYSEVKSLVMKTISNLPDNIINEIKNVKEGEIIRGLFSKIHGAFLSKSLVRNIKLMFDSNKIQSKGNFDLFDKLLIKILNLVKTSLIFHEGKLVFPDIYEAKTISKYLLSDMYGVHFRFNENPQKIL